MSDLLERLRDFVRVYDHTCPALTANIHPVICRCGRCQRDFMERAADEIERLEKEMRGWSKAAMNLFNNNATLIATLEYLRTQAKNGTLHPQVVILNADKALGEIKLLEGKNGLRN